MTYTVKINTRNDLHLPAEVLRRLNLGDDRIVKLEVRGNVLMIIPVDLEPRYTQEELEGLERLHEDEKKKAWTPLKSPKDIDKLLE